MIGGELLTQTVTRLAWSSGTADDWGRGEDTYTDAGTLQMRVEPMDVDESTDVVDVQVGDHRGFAHPSDTLDGRDRLLVDGVTYRIIGPVKVQRTPDGPHHLEVHLRRIG